MRSVGVRELKEHTSQILRRVHEEGEEMVVTRYGRVIARLIPVRQSGRATADLDALWSDLDRLAADIGVAWPDGLSAVEAVSEGRREL